MKVFDFYLTHCFRFITKLNILIESSEIYAPPLKAYATKTLMLRSVKDIVNNLYEFNGLIQVFWRDVIVLYDERISFRPLFT